MTPVLKRCKNRKEHLENVDKKQANHAKITEAEEVNVSLLLSLPMYLIHDILAQVPIYTLLSFKCVCNTFKNILSDPYIAQIHLAKASRDDYSLVIHEKYNHFNILLTPMLDLDKFALFSETNGRCNDKYLSWKTLTMPPVLIPKANKSYGQVACLIGSCNGLLCMQYYANNVTYFYVCNPILGEFTVLPRFEGFAYELGGFGFCPKSKQYKVLRFSPTFGYWDIFTLGKDDEWRRISYSPPQPTKFIEFDSSYKGYIHWIVASCLFEESICSFNLETEQYSYISLPFRPSSFNYTFQIGTLDGLFCFCCLRGQDEFNVYVMEDYGVESSWVKTISIVPEFQFRLNGETARFLDNGVLVIQRPTHLVYYDTRKGTKSNILLKGDYCAMLHLPSLISLKNIVKRENVEQVKKVERKMLPIYSS